MKFLLFTIHVLFVFLAVCFLTSATVYKNSDSMNIIQHIKPVQCNEKELNYFHFLVEKAFVGNKTLKTKRFFYEAIAGGLIFSLYFKINNSQSELLNSCSTVKYYRENIRSLQKAFHSNYMASKSSKAFQYDAYHLIKDHRDIKKYVCKNPVFRKPTSSHKSESIFILLEEKVVERKLYLLKTHLNKYRTGWRPMELNVLQLLIKCDYFEEEKFKLFIKFDYKLINL